MPTKRELEVGKQYLLKLKSIFPEAKIVAAADSASHLIGDGVYTFVLRRYGKESATEKLERDFRDMNIIPEATKELHDLYENWKNLLDNYPDWNWPEELVKK